MHQGVDVCVGVGCSNIGDGVVVPLGVSVAFGVVVGDDVDVAGGESI